jgi:hypothetical protein
MGKKKRTAPRNLGEAVGEAVDSFERLHPLLNLLDAVADDMLMKDMVVDGEIKKTLDELFVRVILTHAKLRKLASQVASLM